MKIEGPRVDPEDIATRKGLVVQPKPDSIDGVSGMLVKAGDQFGIMYATNIPSKGFQKFCIAHELGHYCIDGHSDALLSNGAHFSQAGFRSSDPFEQEADYFAAALLMPELTFRKEMNRHDPGLTCVEELRKACETSLTATAIRYSGLTRDGVAEALERPSNGASCPKGSRKPRASAGLKKGQRFRTVRSLPRLMRDRRTCALASEKPATDA
jgi:Zn-dependent peptidase ImmA (M78 family)